MAHDQRSSKTTINLSVDTNVLGVIRKEAEQKGVSVNSRINTILTDYTMFYKRAEEFESVTFPKEYFEMALEYIDEKKLEEYFDTLLSGLIKTVLMDFGVSINLENTIRYFLQAVAVKSNGYNSVTHYVDENDHDCIILRHSWNIKWSRVACCTLAKHIGNLLHCHYECEPLPKSIIIRILERLIR